MKKSTQLIPLIVEAQNKEQAINVLREMLASLYLTTEYIEITKLKDTLEEYKAQYAEVVDKYKELGEVRHYTQVHDIRTELNFLMRDITDNLVFDINRLKVYYEEYKTIQRAESMKSLKSNEELQKQIKATSTSALRDIVGADEDYNSYVTTASISYGLYIELRYLLSNIEQFTNSLSSEERYLLQVEAKDVK